MSEEGTIGSYSLSGLEHSKENPTARALGQILDEKRDTEQFLRMIAPQYLGVYVLDKETDFSGTFWDRIIFAGSSRRKTAAIPRH